MFPAISVIAILIFSILMTRIASAALENTGLSGKSAKFQSRSAFTGCGFTTVESEKITQHPVRRKIIFTLMLLGNAGIVTVIATLLITFLHKDESSLPWYFNVAILAGGVSILWIVSSSKLVDKWLTKVINKFMRTFTNIQTRDYASLLKLTGEYEVTELNVRKNDWIEGKTLLESNLRNEGITVLGIERLNGIYIGAPNRDVKIKEGDNLIIYGSQTSIQKLDVREKGRKGNLDHEKAKAIHEKVKQKQKQEDEG